MQVIDRKEITNEHGSFIVKETVYNLEFVHGGVRLDSLFGIDGELLDTINIGGCYKDRQICIDDMVFIDTETTGLSRGTGTYAFLVGIGYFREGSFHIKQYFMRDYNEEASMLHSIKELIQGFKGFISFNGKSFDLPILQTRFISNRFRMPIGHYTHIDLLHSSRRLWKDCFESCSLGCLEDNILGFKRKGDIPGHLIPGLYFDYLINRRTNHIEVIFEHNKKDILSLLSLLKRICDIYESPFDNEAGYIDYFRLGNVYEQMGDSKKAEKCYRIYIHKKGISAVNVYIRLANLYKRTGDYQNAVSIWKGIVGREGNFNIHPYVELAKYYEHITKEYQDALALTQKALEIVYRIKRYDIRLINELEHRLKRIKKKAGA